MQVADGQTARSHSLVPGLILRHRCAGGG